MKKLLEISKYITAVGVIAGASLFYDNSQDAARERDEDARKRDKEILEVVEFNSAGLSELSLSVKTIQDTLDEFEAEHKAQGKQIESLAWGLNHIEQFTPDQFEDIMNEMLKKNNGFEMRPISLPRPSSILYEIDTELIGGQ